MPLLGHVERRRRENSLSSNAIRLILFDLESRIYMGIEIDLEGEHTPITDISGISSPCDDEEAICCICWEKNGLFEFNCSHVMHEDCAKQWFLTQNTCPTCRNGF